MASSSPSTSMSEPWTSGTLSSNSRFRKIRSRIVEESDRATQVEMCDRNSVRRKEKKDGIGGGAWPKVRLGEKRNVDEDWQGRKSSIVRWEDLTRNQKASRRCRKNGKAKEGKGCRRPSKKGREARRESRDSAANSVTLTTSSPTISSVHVSTPRRISSAVVVRHHRIRDDHPSPIFNLVDEHRSTENARQFRQRHPPTESARHYQRHRLNDKEYWSSIDQNRRIEEKTRNIRRGYELASEEEGEREEAERRKSKELNRLLDNQQKADKRKEEADEELEKSLMQWTGPIDERTKTRMEQMFSSPARDERTNMVVSPPSNVKSNSRVISFHEESSSDDDDDRAPIRVNREASRDQRKVLDSRR